jgi:hypothetical protein
MAGETARDITREFGAFHALRPTVGKHVTHMSINFAPDDRDLSDVEQEAIGRMWAEGMGYDGYSIISHGDHIHIAASRIKLDGGVVSDSHNYRRSESLIRQIEERFDLIRVESSHLHKSEKAENHKMAPSLAEISLAARGEAPLKLQVQSMLDDLLSEPITASEFVEGLESVGVDVRPNLASTGRLNGFSYGFGDSSWTAKELGRGYTLGNMIKKGFEYEQSRDFETLSAAGQRSKNREHLRRGRPDEDGEPRLTGRSGSGNEDEPKVSGDRNSSAGRDRQGDVAAVEVSGQADGRQPGPSRNSTTLDDEASGPSSSDPQIVDGTAERIDNSSPEAGPGDQGLPSGSEISSGESAPDRVPSASPSSGNPSSRPGGSSPSHAASSRSNTTVTAAILDTEGGWDALIAFLRQWSSAMRQANPSAQIPSPPSYTPEPGSAYDQILNYAGTGQYKIREKKIAEQLSAFGCAKYEVQAIPHRGSEKRVDRLHTTDIPGVMKLRSYFGAKNMDGYDIYVRPAPVQIDGVDHGQPFVFVDDLDLDQVRQLTKSGLPLAIQVESSPSNYHGWIRVGSKPLPAPELTAASQLIAKTIGGDPGAADWRHFGRLAGYTNQKPDRRLPTGQQPFVKIWGDKGHLVAKNGPALMSAARQMIQDQEAASAQKARAINERQAQIRLRQQLEGRDVYADVAEAWERLRSGPDDSATDLSAAMSAIRRGYDPDEVKDALRAVSPNLASRHPDVDRYLDRTIDAAQAKLGDLPAGPPRR